MRLKRKSGFQLPIGLLIRQMALMIVGPGVAGSGSPFLHDPAASPDVVPEVYRRFAVVDATGKSAVGLPARADVIIGQVELEFTGAS